MAQAIEELPTAEREVVRLRPLEGADVGGVARAPVTPEGTVKTRARRGLTRLRHALPAGLAIGLLLQARHQEELSTAGNGALLTFLRFKLALPASLIMIGVVTLSVLGARIATADDRETEAVAPPSRTTTAGRAGEGAPGSQEPVPDRSATPRPHRAAPSPKEVERPFWSLRGVVLSHGVPVTGAEVAL